MSPDNALNRIAEPHDGCTTFILNSVSMASAGGHLLHCLTHDILTVPRTLKPSIEFLLFWKGGLSCWQNLRKEPSIGLSPFPPLKMQLDSPEHTMTAD